MGGFYRRHGIVRADQWFKLGDHKHVKEGIKALGGILDIDHATSWSRRYVEPGDWIVTEANGKCSVITNAEFQHHHTEA